MRCCASATRLRKRTFCKRRARRGSGALHLRCLASSSERVRAQLDTNLSRGGASGAASTRRSDAIGRTLVANVSTQSGQFHATLEEFTSLLSGWLAQHAIYMVAEEFPPATARIISGDEGAHRDAGSRRCARACRRRRWCGRSLRERSRRRRCIGTGSGPRRYRRRRATRTSWRRCCWRG